MVRPEGGLPIRKRNIITGDLGFFLFFIRFVQVVKLWIVCHLHAVGVIDGTSDHHSLLEKNCIGNRYHDSFKSANGVIFQVFLDVSGVSSPLA